MKLNWREGLARVVSISFFVAMIGYEVLTREDLLRNWFSWHNGLIFSLKIIIIPAVIIGIIWWAINWCIRGFKEPEQDINWKEGGSRFAAVIFGISIIVFFTWRWAQTKDPVGASLLTLGLSIVVIGCLGTAFWVVKGFDKPNEDKHHDEYDE